MPAPDTIHDAVKNALVKAGWLITHDPYVIQFEEITLFADLGAERAWRLNLAATRSWLKLRALLADRQSKISNLLAEEIVVWTKSPTTEI
jgi:hypothetical protein